MTVRSLLACALLISLIGCAKPEPEVSCEEGNFSRPPALKCEAAIAAAVDALGDSHPEITRITFRYGFYCLPGRGCRPPSDDGGAVFFEFKHADPLYIDVFYQSGHILVRGVPLPGSP